MKKEYLDEIREKIEGLTEIPEGFCFNQQRVWEKIQYRLKERLMRKDRFYAGMTVILFIVFIVGVELGALFLLRANSGETMPEGTMVDRQWLLPVSHYSFNIKKETSVKSKTHLQKKTMKQDSVETNVIFTAVVLREDKDSTENRRSIIVPENSSTVNRKFPVIHLNTSSEETLYELPEQGKTRTAFFFKKKTPVVVFETVQVDEESKLIKKKQRAIFPIKN